jgi:hypothetical protein
MEMKTNNAQIVLQAKHQMQHPQVVITPPAQSTIAPTEDSSSFAQAAIIGKDDDEEELIKMTANAICGLPRSAGSTSTSL